MKDIEAISQIMMENMMEQAIGAAKKRREIIFQITCKPSGFKTSRGERDYGLPEHIVEYKKFATTRFVSAKFNKMDKKYCADYRGRNRVEAMKHLIGRCEKKPKKKPTK